MKGFWPFPNEITEKITGYLPEYNRRVLRHVSSKWSKIIKVNKDKYYTKEKLFRSIVKRDQYILLRWFIDDYKYLSYGLVDNLDIMISNGSLGCLSIYMSRNFISKIKLFTAIHGMEDNTISLKVLKFLHSYIITSYKRRLLCFGNLSRNREVLVPYMIRSEIINEQLLLTMEEGKLGREIERTFIIHSGYSAKDFVKSLSQYFELSPKFIMYILQLLWDFRHDDDSVFGGSAIYKEDIVKIIRFTGVWNNSICKKIDEIYHKRYEHICGCNKETRLKKRKQ